MPPRILVVEDDLFIKEIVATALGEAGYVVGTASDGLQVWDCLAVALPALIVLDLALPYEDGAAICQKLRANAKTADLPVLVVSAMASSCFVRAALEAGANAFLAKPFDLDELVDRVRRLLAERAAEPATSTDGLPFVPRETRGWRLPAP